MIFSYREIAEFLEVNGYAPKSLQGFLNDVKILQQAQDFALHNEDYEFLSVTDSDTLRYDNEYRVYWDYKIPKPIILQYIIPFDLHMVAKLLYDTGIPIEKFRSHIESKCVDDSEYHQILYELSAVLEYYKLEAPR
jgi:hypothetical protein